MRFGHLLRVRHRGGHGQELRRPAVQRRRRRRPALGMPRLERRRRQDGEIRRLLPVCHRGRHSSIVFVRQLIEENNGNWLLYRDVQRWRMRFGLSGIYMDRALSWSELRAH